jgi:alpha,alpha-trehalose-phosphate synthase [UDP-forming]/trehalose-phosphatase
MTTKRLIVVSNRLPISYSTEGHEEDVDKWTFRMSSGGLVAALSGVSATMKFVWVGWSGAVVAPRHRAKFSERLLREYNAVPVYLSESVADLHYNGFSNSVVWPLFHYLTADVHFDERYWRAYKAANRQFANVLCEIGADDDVIWVHDYHLMLLPAMLRQRLPRAKLGFFLHIPFPSSEIFRVVPVRERILEGMLASDLIGFHTFDYASHFRSACARLLGLATTSDSVLYDGAKRSIGAYPVGINPQLFFDGLERDDTREAMERLRARYNPRGDQVVLLGVDRLDYIKGVPHKLAAFEQFLTDHPEWRERVTLVQIAVPTRTDVVEYQQLRADVFESVGRINGNLGSLTHQPVVLLNQSVQFPQLCALYALSDACIVSSNRDGMNLVSFEYIACQRERHGVLVLSEFAGAAQSLSGALIVNPWNTQQLADSIHRAITMPPDERADKHARLFEHCVTHTSEAWGTTFVRTLAELDLHKLNRLSAEGTRAVCACYAAAERRRLLLVDDDGTLAPLHRDFAFTRPDANALRQLSALAADKRNRVVIVSGRDRITLERWFAGIDVAIAAEHGYYYRESPSAPWIIHDEQIDTDSWKSIVESTFLAFRERTPGSLIERKESSLCWHFRSADPDFGQWQAVELREHLEALLSGRSLDIHIGNQTVEVRPQGMTKAAVLTRFPDLDQYEFVAYIGADEDIFAALHCDAESSSSSSSSSSLSQATSSPIIVNVDNTFTFSVGTKSFQSEYFLRDHQQVSNLLDHFIIESNAD